MSERVIFAQAFPDPVSTPGPGAVTDAGAAVRGAPKGHVWIYIRSEDGWHLTMDLCRGDAGALGMLLGRFMSRSGIKAKPEVKPKTKARRETSKKLPRRRTRGSGAAVLPVRKASKKAGAGVRSGKKRARRS